MTSPIVRLFHLCVYTWLMLYLLALLLLGDAAWSNAPVDLFTSHARVVLLMQRRLDLFTAGHGAGMCLALLALALFQLRHARWWLGLLVWALFRAITFRTWLAGNGGIQLMENMLLWSALMSLSGRMEQVAVGAFWIGRLQLLLVYAVTAAHKCSGTTWIDGTALLRVANDPLFHLGWLAAKPGICTTLTYLALVWMSLFATAVWWRPSRRIFLGIGVIFHLCTAVFMDIPQMGFAFIACYAIWLDEGEARGLLDRIARAFARTHAPKPVA